MKHPNSHDVHANLESRKNYRTVDTSLEFKLVRVRVPWFVWLVGWLVVADSPFSQSQSPAQQQSKNVKPFLSVLRRVLVVLRPTQPSSSYIIACLFVLSPCNEGESPERIISINNVVTERLVQIVVASVATSATAHDDYEFPKRRRRRRCVVAEKTRGGRKGTTATATTAWTLFFFFFFFFLQRWG